MQWWHVMQLALTRPSSPLPRADRQAILDVSGEVPQSVIKSLLDACRSGVFNRVQQQVGRAAPCMTEHGLFAL